MARPSPLVFVALLLSLGGCAQSIKSNCGVESAACCEAGRCDVGLVCGGDAICRPCGREGLACCSGSRCELGAECRTDLLCHRCGAQRGECCAAGLCDRGLACNGTNLCVSPCAESCTPGEKRCASAGGVEQCGFKVPPCASWSTLVASCPSDQLCVSGACAAKCPGACVLDSALCVADGLRVCVLDATTGCNAYKVPPASPDNPACVAGLCDGAICWESPAPQGNTLFSMGGLAADDFLAVDRQGNVLRRRNAAWTFDRRASNDLRVNALAYCFPSNFIAVGNSGLALRRNAAGWATEAIPGNPVDLLGVACDVNHNAVAVGRGGAAFLRSPSGTWTKLTTGTTKDLYAVGLSFRYSLIFMTGAGGAVLRCDAYTSGGPISCSPEAIGWTTSPLYGVFVTVLSEVYAVGGGGVVLHRHDNASWSQEAVGVLAQDLHAVGQIDDAPAVYVAGAGGAFATSSDGQSWFAQRFTPATLNSVFAVDKTHLFAGGDGGELWFSDSGGLGSTAWRLVAGRDPASDTLHAMAGRSATDVYAVGGEGLVLHKSGDAWRHEARGVTVTPLSGVTAVSADELYAVGNLGTILAKRGGQWAKEGVGLTSNALFAAFNDGVTVHAVGQNGTWLEKTVGGAPSSWRRLDPQVPTKVLAAIAGRLVAGGPASEIWAVGQGCTAVKKVGAVITRETIPICNGDQLFAVAEAADGELMMAGENALLLHRVGGAWSQEYPLGTLDRIFALALTGNGEAWAAAEGGQLLHRSASGTWRSEGPQLTSHDLMGLYAAPQGDLFVSGVGGLIWRRK